MSELQEAVKVNKDNAFLRLIRWMSAQNDRLLAEEEEIAALRLERVRAEEEAMELYGELTPPEEGEEPDSDFHLFVLLDKAQTLWKTRAAAHWTKVAEAAAAAPENAGLHRRIERHENRLAKRTERMMNRAKAEDGQPETFLDHLPASWQTHYLQLEDRVMTGVEGIEAGAIGLWKRTGESLRSGWLQSKTALQNGCRAVRTYWKAHKTLRAGILAGVLALVLLIGVAVKKHTYYEYSYRGKVLGTVTEKSAVTQVVDIVRENMTALYGAEVALGDADDLAFTRRHGSEWVNDSPDRILENLSYLHDVSVVGYAIVADGKQVALLETAAQAEAVQAQILNGYKQPGTVYDAIGFAETVSIERVTTSVSAFLSPEEAMEQIRAGSGDAKVYRAVAGDTFSGIAKMAGLSTGELHVLNPEADTEKVKVGQEFILEQPKPLLTVRTESVETYEAEIPYETTYTENSNLFQGQSTLKVAGKNGKQTVTASVTRENGAVVSEQILKTAVKEEPVAQVVARGSKAIPARIGTGTFIWPTVGRISSKYGMRWGRLHQGLDITNSLGTPIYASDGGEVIFAGWETSYGYIVRINHGNNVVTCYAHCRKILVGVGEMVYQGQTIAEMGSTGNSTGPHVHFEVRISNKANDPLNYLP